MNWRKPLIFAGLYLTGSKIPHYLREIERVTKLPQDEIREYQEEKLKQLLLHSYRNVPYYHRILPEVGVIINGKVHLENFEKIPLLTKEIIRREKENLYSKDYAGRKYYKNTSGGSTGTPVKFIQDKDYNEWNIATKIHVNQVLGKEIGNREIKLWGSSRDIIKGTLTSKEKLINYLYNRKHFNSYKLNFDSMKDLVVLNNEFRPISYWSYADSALEFSKFVINNDIKLHPPKMLISTINPLYSKERETIENAFNCPVYDQYGSREVGWIACQYDSKKNLHTFPWFNYVEVSGINNEFKEKNKEGKIIITSLRNYSMPLLRYDIGDVGVSGSDELCDMGKSITSLERIYGRTLGYFKKKDGSLVHSHFIVEALFFKEWIRRFQIIQTNYDNIKIKIEICDEPVDSDLVEIEYNVRNIMGNICEVQFDFVDMIEPNKSGKYLYTICDI